MHRALPAIVSACAVLAAASLSVMLYDLGPLSAHMLLHILLMSAVAPLTAVFMTRDGSEGGPAAMWLAAAVQIGLLWAWHLPAMQEAAQTPAVMLGMHASLLAAAVAFWRATIRLSRAQRWHAVPALLLTGKLACLLAALMIFAPRALYQLHTHDAGPSLSPLHDQQLAGLLMIVACPASYILAAVAATAQVVAGLTPTRPATLALRN